MLTVILVMAGCTMWLEMRIVNSCSPLGDLLERTRVGAAVFSFLLSFVVTMAFGAEGVTVLGAGVLSTAAIQPWYAMRKNGTLAKMRVSRVASRESFNASIANISAKKDVYVRRAQMIGAFIMTIWKILTFPFMLLGLMLDWIDRLQRRFAK